MHEILEGMEKAFNVKIDYEVLADLPAVYCDPEFTKELANYVQDMVPGFVKGTDHSIIGSDDFAFIAQEVPTTYFNLGAKVDGCEAQHHNPRALIDESAMPYGAAVHAESAYKWLNRGVTNEKQ